MNLEEFRKIISTVDCQQICEQMEKSGFRHANPDYFWEFDIDEIEEKGRVAANLCYEDVFADMEYHVTLYKEVKGYEGIEFVHLRVFRIYMEEKKIPIPYKNLLYTNAPVNEEYERALNSSIPCGGCGRLYVKRRLVNCFGEYLCPRCLLREAKKDK